MSARLVSVNVGLPRDIAWQGKTIHTGIWKIPQPGRVQVRRLNLDGDGQGDLAGHGGVNRPVLVYQLDSYQHWERELGRNDFSYGQFGENFTVEGLADAEVCIGDRYRIGSAVFEISQPRVTCYRLGIRMDVSDMAAKFVSHHRPGFYIRVLQEGDVGAGDEIVKLEDGPEHMTVADIDGMLYLGRHSHEQLESALRIPALSAGWQESFKAMLQQAPGSGNPGLVASSGPPPAWTGFRPLRVSQLERESKSVLSVVLVPADSRPLVTALPGQFIVVRLQPTPDGPSLSRNYSLSDIPSIESYRISVKQELHGAASTYIHDHLKVGDSLDVAAPRGSFTLQPGDSPVVLLGAGVGATPLLAMLHALAHQATPRQVWWLFGARNGEEHPFADESRHLIKTLSNGRRCIFYSRPDPQDRPGVDFDEAGRMTIDGLEKLGVVRAADFYLCGPSPFLQGMKAGLTAWGVAEAQVHTEVFGPGESMTPGIAERAHPAPHPPAGPAGPGPQVSFSRSGLNVRWDAKFSNLLELAEACDVPVRWSCRTGVCHTCESGLIGGSIVYRPDPLEPPAAGNLLLCCAQPREDVIVDL